MKPVGRDFPVFLDRDTGEEYALARTERKHGRGYRGFEFFASPDVTLAEDLARRDLTINAMARDEKGVLIDPFGGQADLRAGVLRHVSPAFVEDPLRVLRVARFAARFGFVVAPETARLMRVLVGVRRARGACAGARLAGARARPDGAASGAPALRVARLRRARAVAARSGRDRWRGRGARRGARPGLRCACRARSNTRRGATSPFRSAMRSSSARLGDAGIAANARSGDGVRTRRDVRCAERMSERLKVPQDCRDAARLAARWHRAVDRAPTLPPSARARISRAADALRRPERLGQLLETCEAAASCRRPALRREFAAASCLRAALDVVKGVDAGAIARAVAGKSGRRGAGTVARSPRSRGAFARCAPARRSREAPHQAR